jgi:uncharacterized phage protein (TIGR02216 family)
MICFGDAAARLCGAASMLLGWRPEEFWNATPAELATAMTVGVGVDVPDAETLEKLRHRFPDKRGGSKPESLQTLGKVR